jgi:D-glycero-alpha-D-manno-heptose-7-phosphate kinase
VTREIGARAPTRIDFGGGWTDVPPYCDREGGFVCNVAINRYSTARLTASSSNAAERDATSLGESSPLVRAALRRSGARGVHVALINDFPVAAGLGGSSAASAAVLGALAEWRGEEWSAPDIAEEGRRIEVEELGIAGGRQDHYAATHGGALALSFSSSVSVRRIPLTTDVKDDLVARATLIYTGESRISGDTISAVLGAYEAGEAHVLFALRRMREIAVDMAAALERADLDGVGELLREHWQHQRSLHPSIPTARIDEIVSRARQAGALGAKAMGASGGGCVLVMARSEQGEAVRDAVRPLGEILDFSVDESGLLVTRAAA